MIDKSLRQHYAWGGPGGKSPSAPGRSGPPGGGGGGRGRDPSPPSRPAPSPHRDEPVYVAPVTTAKAPPSILARGPLEDTKGDTPERRAEQFFLDIKQKEKKEQLEADWDFQDAKAQAPKVLKPKTVTYDKGNPFTDRLIPTTVGQTLYDPKTSQNALLKRPGGILGTMGKIALTGLTAGAGAGLFGKTPALFAKGLQYKKNYDRIQKSALGKKLGLFDASNLTSTIKKAADRRSRPKGMPEHLGEPGFKTRVDTPEDRDGVQPTLAQTITGGTGLEEGQKLLGMDDKQIQQIYQGRDLLKQTIESGMYQDRRLNMNEIKMLQGHMMKMENLIQAIEKAQAPVPVAHGGRIDKPFTGRSRDI